jgi:hypothetical protein
MGRTTLKPESAKLQHMHAGGRPRSRRSHGRRKHLHCIDGDGQVRRQIRMVEGIGALLGTLGRRRFLLVLLVAQGRTFHASLSFL